MRDPVLSSLSVILSQQPWTTEGIKSCLTRILPPSFNRSHAAAARHLLRAAPGSTTPDPATIAKALHSSALALRLRDHHRKDR